mmetsp:Transcript_28872/g.46896  ORF Transcript_28872/g.46896 Transcript_28872/m.46896 type:complete len:423 (-) Transcript_28872:146-1414(-)
MSDEDEDDVMDTVLILDLSSSLLKVGYAGAKRPHGKIEPVVGSPGPNSKIRREVYGDEALLHSSNMLLSHPISRGKIKDWEGLEKLAKYAFESEARALVQENPVIVCMPYDAPREDWEKMTKMMFEKFSVPFLHLVDPAVAALCYAQSGGNDFRITGCAVHADLVTHAVPVVDGRAVKGAISSLDFGMQELTVCLKELLMESKTQGKSGLETLKESLKSAAAADSTVPFGMERKDFLRDESLKVLGRSIRRELMFSKTSSDFEKDCTHYSAEQVQEIELTSTSKVQVGKERVIVPEVIYRPEISKTSNGSLIDICHNAIKSCEKKTHKALLSNVTMFGSVGNVKHADKRLQDELARKIDDKDTKVRVMQSNIGMDDAFYGAMLLRQKLKKNGDSEESWIGMDEYEESGAVDMAGKCWSMYYM